MHQLIEPFHNRFSLQKTGKLGETVLNTFSFQFYFINFSIASHLSNTTAAALYVCGAPGTGKTMTVTSVLDAIHTEQSQSQSWPEFHVIKLNALEFRQAKSIYPALVDAVIKETGESASPPPSAAARSSTRRKSRRRSSLGGAGFNADLLKLRKMLSKKTGGQNMMFRFLSAVFFLLLSLIIIFSISN
jgi:Cdc6-like AAA superfamily ATPase